MLLATLSIQVRVIESATEGEASSHSAWTSKSRNGGHDRAGEGSAVEKRPCRSRICWLPFSNPYRPQLARSLKDLQDLVHELRAKGVTLKATEQPVDTSTAAGKAFFDMPGVFAEFETNLRRERQREGIAAGKARGVYKGRKPKIHPAEVRRLHAGERLSPTAIARRLGIARSSVYRFLTSTG